jgi:YVTN family beta-propeller protein
MSTASERNRRLLGGQNETDASLKSRASIYSLRFAAALNAFLLVAAQAQRAPYSHTVTQNGTSVTVEVRHVDPAKTADDPLREFENVTVQVRWADATTNSPLAGGSPAAWLDLRPGVNQTTAEQCVGKVRRLAEGSTFSRAELDLTSFFVVTMNGDATLTVVDPRFGYGDTRLLALVSLDGPGEDWALTSEGNRLFVSEPTANEVAAIDTTAWKSVAAVSSIPKAARIALQPDEAYLWVAYSGDNNDSGVFALSARDMKVVARIRTGRGYHHIAFSEDSSFAFVTNPLDGKVSVIDVRKLAKVADVSVGAGPAWIAYSALAKAAYVANEGDGRIVAIDGVEHSIRATMNASPGLGQIRFAPGGRFALVVNPTNDMIYVIDSASNRIVQKGKLGKGPDQIAFTNKTAHIRQRRSDSVLMIPLASLGQPDTPLSPADFAGGHRPPGAVSLPTPADGIVQASGENGVLVANPGDKSV